MRREHWRAILSAVSTASDPLLEKNTRPSGLGSKPATRVRKYRPARHHYADVRVTEVVTGRTNFPKCWELSLDFGILPGPSRVSTPIKSSTSVLVTYVHFWTFLRVL